MSANQVVQLAAQAGRIILENGGEVYRVEETVNRVCATFGVRGSATYATPTVLIVSVSDRDGEAHSAMERISSRVVNLDKIDAVNRFSRELEATRPDLRTARELLEAVRGRRAHPGWMVVLFSALACGAFALVFQGSMADVFPAFVAGGLVRLGAIGLGRLRLNDFFINVIGGAIASFSGWGCVKLGMGDHQDIVTISALMLLVPGLLLTNAVRDIAAGDLISGISRLMEAFFTAIAIACGTALAYGVIPLIGGGSL